MAITERSEKDGWKIRKRWRGQIDQKKMSRTERSEKKAGRKRWR